MERERVPPAGGSPLAHAEVGDIAGERRLVRHLFGV